MRLRNLVEISIYWSLNENLKHILLYVTVYVTCVGLIKKLKQEVIHFPEDINFYDHTQLTKIQLIFKVDYQ